MQYELERPKADILSPDTNHVSKILHNTDFLEADYSPFLAMETTENSQINILQLNSQPIQAKQQNFALK